MTKTTSAERPQTIAALAVNAIAYNWAVTETESGYEFNQVIFDHHPTRNEVINACIQHHFPDGEEQALQRKGIIDRNDPEFVAYVAQVNAIKEEVKMCF